MKIHKNPSKEQWQTLAKRPELNALDLTSLVATVFTDVQNKGDDSLKKYTLEFDKVHLENLLANEEEIQNAGNVLSDELKKAIQTAKNNIEIFHSSQKEIKNPIETTEGVICWRENRGIEKVGIYIPGGSAPLFSTVLMLGIPAQLADCKEIILCSPPDKNGNLHPAILYTAHLVGITSIYKVGGIQAIAAMSIGTESIPKVDKIFGPGNQYVTAAKKQAQNIGIAIDMPAGPSEVLVIADKNANSTYIAADLLSQAEHGKDSQVILLSTNYEIIEKVLIDITIQTEKLPRSEIIVIALENSKAILMNTLDECIEFSNLYAPEHLILAIDNPEKYTDKIQHAGSVFLGKYSCESAGDYASGTNHTLPTNGFAKNYSGVSLDSFVKKITFQHISEDGIQNLGKTIEIMAEAEELLAHKNAVTIRIQSLENKK